MSTFVGGRFKRHLERKEENMAGLQPKLAKLGVAFATLLLAASIAPSYALAGQAENVSGGG